MVAYVCAIVWMRSGWCGAQRRKWMKAIWRPALIWLVWFPPSLPSLSTSAGVAHVPESSFTRLTAARKSVFSFCVVALFLEETKMPSRASGGDLLSPITRECLPTFLLIKIFLNKDNHRVVLVWCRSNGLQCSCPIW